VSSGVRYSKKTAINRETNLNNWTSMPTCVLQEVASLRRQRNAMRTTLE